jgi:hypothetical protein
MYAHWSANFIVVLATAITVAMAVLVHYEGLRWMSFRLGTLPAASFLYLEMQEFWRR